MYWKCLPISFNKLATWLITQPFAHGDLKPGNITMKENINNAVPIISHFEENIL